LRFDIDCNTRVTPRLMLSLTTYFTKRNVRAIPIIGKMRYEYAPWFKKFSLSRVMDECMRFLRITAAKPLTPPTKTLNIKINVRSGMVRTLQILNLLNELLIPIFTIFYFTYCSECKSKFNCRIKGGFRTIFAEC
jgi:hypothetical protein